MRRKRHKSVYDVARAISLTTAEKFDKLKELLDSFNVNYSVKKTWTH